MYKRLFIYVHMADNMPGIYMMYIVSMFCSTPFLEIISGATWVPNDYAQTDLFLIISDNHPLHPEWYSDS